MLKLKEFDLLTISQDSYPKRPKTALPLPKTDSQIAIDHYNILKRSRSDTLWKSIGSANGAIQRLRNSLMAKRKQAYQDQKRNIHEYLQGEQKFRKEFLLNTFFKIEANERKKQHKPKKKIKTTAPEDIKNQTLKNIKKGKLEEDLKAYASISDVAFYKFSEKLSLYNNYSTAFINEPNDAQLVKQFMHIKPFKLVTMKKSIPMSAYIRRVRTLYTSEELHSLSPLAETKEDRLKKSVINAFTLKKKPPEKEKESFLKAKRELEEKKKDLEMVLQNFKEAKHSLSDIHEKGLFQCAKNGDWKEVLRAIEKKPELINSKDYLKRTLLHLAVKDGNSKVVEELLKKKIDIQARDTFQRTAKQVASNLKKIDIQKQIELFEKDKNIKGILKKMA